MTWVWGWAVVYGLFSLAWIPVEPGMTCKDIGQKSRIYVIPDVTELARWH